ncbi:unnamed protein product, partial [Medioppia subpectinata]
MIMYNSILPLLLWSFMAGVTYSSDYDCQATYVNGNSGICVPNPTCCKGTAQPNVCLNNNYCCWGTYDCRATTVPNPSAYCPTIKARTSWKAMNPKQSQAPLTPVRHVFIHHTNTASCPDSQNGCWYAVRTIQSTQMRLQGAVDIKWNFLIGGDGQVYEGTGWTLQSSDLPWWDQKSLSIAFVGNYNNVRPSDQMMSALNNLLSCGVSRGYIQYDYQL